MSIYDTLEPIGFDQHEEKLLRQKEKVWKAEIYPFFRPLVHKCSGDTGLNVRGSNVRVGLGTEEKGQEAEGEQDKGEKVNTKGQMALGFMDIQGDE